MIDIRLAVKAGWDKWPKFKDYVTTIMTNVGVGITRSLDIPPWTPMNITTPANTHTHALAGNTEQ